MRVRHPVSIMLVAPAVLAGALTVVTAPPAHAARTVNVSTADQLRQALSAAQPGDIIVLADGRYAGRFVIARSGTPAETITLRGSRAAVLDGGATFTGRVLELRASYWRLDGFTITNGQKGLMALGAQHTVVGRLLVHRIGDEAIHFRDNSSDNTVQNSEVRDTGLRSPGFGEAIYLGQSVNNWTDGPDRSDRNRVLNNRLGPNVTAEHLDIKEGTTGGEVRGNTFDGRGQSGTNSGESWINAKGNDYVIAGNTGAAAFRSGYKTRVLVAGFGCGNQFAGNTGSVAPFQVAGWGFDIANSQCAGRLNVVYADNTVTGAALGMSNIALTPTG